MGGGGGGGGGMDSSKSTDRPAILRFSWDTVNKGPKFREMLNDMPVIPSES